MIRKLIILSNQDLLIMTHYSRKGLFACFVKVRVTALD